MFSYGILGHTAEDSVCLEIIDLFNNWVSKHPSIREEIKPSFLKWLGFVFHRLSHRVPTLSTTPTGRCRSDFRLKGLKCL